MTINLANASITATGSNTTRTLGDRFADVVNVLDYGADNTNNAGAAAATTTAINAAIIAAAGLGVPGIKGGTVFFPPGVYVVNGPLYNNTSSSTVRLVGSNVITPQILGSVNGFIIDQNDGSSGGANRLGDIQVVENLSVRNTYGSLLSLGFNSTVGAIRFNGVTGGIIRNCKIEGWNGIVAFSNVFQQSYELCQFTPGISPNPQYGMVGIQAGDCIINCCNISQGFWTAIMASGGNTSSGNGPYIIGTRIETCVEGIRLGSNVSLTNSQCIGFFIAGLQMEQCNDFIIVQSANAGSISGADISTGAVGTAMNINNGASGGNGVTVTIDVSGKGYTLDNLGWTSGTRGLQIINDATYTTGGAWVTATYVTSTTFTYSSAVTGAMGASAQYEMKIQHNLRVANCSNTVFYGLHARTAAASLEFAAVDLLYTGSPTQIQNTMIGCNSDSGTWSVPLAVNKASWQYINCNQPAGSTTDTLGNTAGMNFADLPGQAGVHQPGPIEGDEYDIINSNTATWGATAAAGGSNHVKVRYNGSNWTVVGA